MRTCTDVPNICVDFRSHRLSALPVPSVTSTDFFGRLASSSFTVAIAVGMALVFLVKSQANLWLSRFSHEKVIC